MHSTNVHRPVESSPFGSPSTGSANVVAQGNPSAAGFPELSFGDAPVQASSLQAAGTGLWVAVGWLGVLASLGALVITTMGLGLIGLVIAPIVDFFRARKVRALIHGSGVQVSNKQLPEIHACVEQFSRRLGLKEAPAVYVVESEMQNGFAAKIGRKHVVLLTDDIVWGSLYAKDPRALGFVVGHELAHVALGHTGTIRSTLRTIVRPLSRLDELTCDNVAKALVNNERVAFDGLKLLAVGPQLSRHVNDEALIEQAREVMSNKLSKKAEGQMTHPLIMRRIANIVG